MNEQNNQQPNEPTQSSKNTWITTITVVITAIIVGGGVYAWQQSNLNSIEQSLQQQIINLQNQVKKLQQTQLNQGDNTSQYENDLSETTTPPPSLPTTCEDEFEGIPVITSLSTYSGSVGTRLEIKGCNFAGFEGDKNAWIENAQGSHGSLYGEMGSTAKLLKVTLESPLCQKDTSYSGLPCDAWLTLTPGIYKIYAAPWGKESNKVEFTIR